MALERRIPLEGSFNCRDLGGYPGDGSRTVRWGRVFRSDALHALTEKDRRRLESLGIRRVIDLRSPGEAEKYPDILPAGAVYENINPQASLAQQAGSLREDDRGKVEKLKGLAETPEGRDFLVNNKNAMASQMRALVKSPGAIAAYRRFFSSLAGGGPLIFHCQGGKDRTGLAALLFLLVLGVDRRIAREDYLLTREMNRERNRRRMDEYRRYTDHPLVLEYLEGLMDTREEYIDAALEEMDRLSQGASPLAPGGYLRVSLGLGEKEIDTLRALYLEPLPRD
ncbi:MAG: tyrosine-protein phosphatase [Treponema sp.]|jgi:protein-tyrosine phosphatase|nr:tyrosine-protein phosphatase [Treponema sp.]